ncbi:MAG: hypothetical protein MJZ82_01805 [Paludibacteraceae bacterium]|nr:hypothetical protein [Paludibacteraceae bacterium]
MKRFFKIAGITLGSLVGLVLIVACIAVWIVFTPKRLTPIVRQVADKFILCEHEVGDVDLTFFSTFPEFGLHVDGICLVNPMEGAPSDTLLYAPDVVAKVNVVSFLREKDLQVRDLQLDEMDACVYINSEGENNFSVFVTNPDTTDTTAFSLPFNTIAVNHLSISAKHLIFEDYKDSISANTPGLSLKAKIGSWEDVNLQLDAPDATVALKDVTYADHLHLTIDLPGSVDIDNMHFALRKAIVSVNDYELQLDGQANLKPEINLDINVNAEKWKVKPAIALLPESIRSSLSDIDVDGLLSLNADIKGIYDSVNMPLVDAHILLTDAEGKYKPLPYTIKNMHADLQAHLDLNNKPASRVIINNLDAKTLNSRVSAKGNIDELLDNMLFNLALNLDANIPDFKYFLPKNMDVTGHAKGTAQACIRLNDLTSVHLEKGVISGDLMLKDIDYSMDSMIAKLPNNTHLTFRIPNATPSRKKVEWLQTDIEIQGVNFEMINTLKAKTQATKIQIETGDLIHDDRMIYATLGFQGEKELKVDIDTIHAILDKPDITAFVEYNRKDTTLLPNFNTTISAAHLKGNMGYNLDAETGKIALSAATHVRNNGENILLKLNPTAKIDLSDGKIKLASFPKEVDIPQIVVSYSNKLFEISKSKISLGNSDFSLTGDISNMSRWMQKKGNLQGKLAFTSNHTDVNELMELFSADKGSEETDETIDVEESAPVQEEKNDKEPFLVPTSLDLTLNTHIKEAEVFNQTARNLGGRIYVKDGTLVLEEVGFVCNAAKLQLTAMYRTPRRNHLYVGFDYHMLDVKIEELIKMIPQLDTLIPMLSTFRGKAEFHLAAETYLKSDYTPKTSTLRGACSIFGKDLVVLDNETFTKISKLLSFKKKTENKVDSLSAEITLYKDEIDVYPFTVSIDNYTAALGGRHNLDMSFDYHVNLLSPIYLGVDVSGTFDDLDIKLAPCVYAKDFKPLFHGKVDTQAAELRTRIRESMQKNVKIQSDEN